MRIECFKRALLSALIISSLMASAVAATLILFNSSVSASPNSYEVIIRGKDTTYNVQVLSAHPTFAEAINAIIPNILQHFHHR